MNRLLLASLLCTTAAATIVRADTWSWKKFTRPVNAPVISPNKKSVFTDPISKKPVHWEKLHTFNPAAIVRDGKVYVLYRAEDDSGAMKVGGHSSRLGLAESKDGVHFTRLPAPVLYADNDAQRSLEDPGGVEDPRIVEAPDGTYILTYTQWNHEKYTIGLATSKDLRTWKKLGPIFQGHKGYEKLLYKSGGIVTSLEHGKLTAVQLLGKYWMYWGEVEVHLASSPDLLHWSPVEEKPGVPLVLLKARKGMFDSGFPETGPPPLVTSAGIVMLYNAKNAEGVDGDAALPAGGYSVGEALFAAGDPSKLLERHDKPVFRPELPFEKSGQYVAGTTFAEGLAWFKDRWWMYYGCADSFVGVAVSDDKMK
ncbi:MAG: glycoside hydrolase family 130 protein [Polyangia bacterium]